MVFEIAQIIVRRGKAYIPSFGETPDRLSINTEPVDAVDLGPQEIVMAVERDRATDIRHIPSPSAREMRRPVNLLPRVTGAAAWKALAQSARANTITSDPDRIALRSFRFERKGRAVGGPDKIVVFPHAGVEGESYTSHNGSGALDYKQPESGGQVLGMGWGGSASHYAQYDGVYLGAGTGDTLIYLVYANGTGYAHNLSVYVDGVNKGTITVQSTGGWGYTYSEFATASLNLGNVTEGSHSIKFVPTADGSNTNIDYFYFNRVGQSTKYYYADGKRIAMRKTTGGSSEVYYLLSDHLGSTVSVVNADGSSPRSSA